MTSPRASEIVPDFSAIERYAEMVFGYLDGYVPVRALSESGTAGRKPVTEFHRIAELPQVLNAMAGRAARESRGLYVVPATVARPGSARVKDIDETGVVVIDLDAGDIRTARDHLARHMGPPTLVVASGGVTSDGQAKLHLYWRLTEAARGDDLERVRSIRELIARKAGGDGSFKSLHQPIRVAGSIHGKNGRQALTRIVADTGREYELTELWSAAEDMPALPGFAELDADVPAKPKGLAVSDLMTRPIREGGADGTTRFEVLSKIIGHWVRTHRLGHCTLDEAWAAVMENNEAMIRPPWSEDRLRREFEALRQRDFENHGPPKDTAHIGTGNGSLSAPPGSDDALAQTFADLAVGKWRHVPIWGKWMHWDGMRWIPDETRAVRDIVRQVCRANAQQLEKDGDARRLASDRTIAAVLRIAGSDPALATRSDAWDAHPKLLNTPGGIVDLETGKGKAHDPALLITQITTASPGKGCPRWHQFLGEITDGDATLQFYLARLAGYCLTGDTSEQVFAFFHGPGANGKSVFLNVLGTVLGDYTSTATSDTFMASRSPRHLTELAGLRAARLVIVPETENGQSWAEARIKLVTGGEKVRANFMRQDHFEFRPQFKLIVAGNHRPALTGVGEFMRRRLHLVPFEVTIPQQRRDRNLTRNLLEERDGILGWMIDGCADWRKRGLAPPARVLAAADEYFRDEDVVGQWLEEHCHHGPAHAATAHALFANWSSFAEAAGHSAGSQKALGSVLRERGLVPAKVHGQRGWKGIGLRAGTPDTGGGP